MPSEYLKPLLQSNGGKIVLLVMDGLGGLPVERGGQAVHVGGAGVLQFGGAAALHG